MNSAFIIEELFKEKLNFNTIENLKLILDDIQRNTKYSNIDDLTIILVLFKQLKEEGYLQSLVKLDFIEINKNLTNINKKNVELLRKKVRKYLRQISVSFYEDLKKKEISQNLILNERDSKIFDFIKKQLKTNTNITHLGGGLELFSFYRNIPNYFFNYKIKNIEINLLTIEKINYLVSHLDTKKSENNEFILIEQMKFDLSLIYGINNHDSIYFYLLDYYLKKNDVEIIDLLNKMSSNYIFALKLFDLIDKKIRFDICEFLLKKLNYDTFFISFSTKTLTGKKMSIKRKEVWLENMCFRLNLNFDIFETKNELFYIIKR